MDFEYTVADLGDKPQEVDAIVRSIIDKAKGDEWPDRQPPASRIGLTPILQMILVPLITLFFTRRFSRPI